MTGETIGYTEACAPARDAPAERSHARVWTRLKRRFDPRRLWKPANWDVASRATLGRWTTSLTLSLGALAGCKSSTVDTSPSAKVCDQERLGSLAAELDASEPDARVMIVSEGLLEACGRALSPTVHAILSEVARPNATVAIPFEDPVHRAAIERACPAHEQIDEVMTKAGERGAAVAKLCGFGRYGLMSEDELRSLDGHALFAWTTHDLLLESGTPTEVANTISRAMFRVHDVVFANQPLDPPRGLELVSLPALAPVRAGTVVYMSQTELVVNERPLAKLTQGRLEAESRRGHTIVPLFAELEDEREKYEHIQRTHGAKNTDVMVLAVDAGVTFGAAVDVIYTANRAGFEHFDLVVEPTEPVRRAIRVEPPGFASLDGPAPPPFSRVLILDDGYRVLGGPGESEPKVLAKLDPEGHDPASWDRAGLAALVHAQVSASGLVDARLSADNSIAMDVVLATAITLLGPDCKPHEGGADCVFSRLIFEVGAG